MSKRGWYVVAILLVWGVTLGWHVKRLYFRPAAELLAEAARGIPPGTAYYVVTRDGRRIGWAQTDVDTLPSASGFLLEDRLVLGEGLLSGLDPLDLRIEATLSRTFTLQRFDLEVAGIPGIRQVQGEVHGDSVLALGFRGAGPARSERIPLEEGVVVAAAWPMRFAAEREVELGERYELDVYDPTSGSRRTMGISVLRQETRTFTDSVTADAGRWISARLDTVQAWQVEHDLSGITLTSWVDEDGRLLDAELPGGIRLERTAFELAYFGERVPERLPGQPPAAPPSDPASHEDHEERDR